MHQQLAQSACCNRQQVCAYGHVLMAMCLWPCAYVNIPRAWLSFSCTNTVKGFESLGSLRAGGSWGAIFSLKKGCSSLSSQERGLGTEVIVSS